MTRWMRCGAAVGGRASFSPARRARVGGMPVRLRRLGRLQSVRRGLRCVQQALPPAFQVLL